jgi:hypothetical protein
MAAITQLAAMAACPETRCADRTGTSPAAHVLISRSPRRPQFLAPGAGLAALLVGTVRPNVRWADPVPRGLGGVVAVLSTLRLERKARTTPPRLPSTFAADGEAIAAEGAARILQQHRGSSDIKAMAQAIVADHRTRKAAIPGIGHPIHKPIDPRTPRLFQLAKEQGYYGTACELMLAIAAEAEHSTGKSLPVNATGAIAAIATELGLDWRMCRGIAVMGRAIGLVGHIAEEIRNPVATEIWQRLDDEVGQAHLHLPNLG